LQSLAEESNALRPFLGSSKELLQLNLLLMATDFAVSDETNQLLCAVAAELVIR